MVQDKSVYVKLFYDGERYYGWAKQPSRSTIQGALEECLQKVGCENVATRASSRTDAGVSATSQVVKISCKGEIRLDALNRVLPEDIAVTHATQNIGRVLSKTYLYVYPERWRNPELVKEAAKIVENEVFEALFKKGGSKPSSTCSIALSSFKGAELVQVSAKGFGYQQVRKIVKLLEMVDQKKVQPCELKALKSVPSADSRWLILVQTNVEGEWKKIESGIEKAKKYINRKLLTIRALSAKWELALRFL